MHMKLNAFEKSINTTLQIKPLAKPHLPRPPPSEKITYHLNLNTLFDRAVNIACHIELFYIL